ncbi:MAG: GUN4-like family, partial [Capsulimonas sp.]|nr:GUN4-like family [Capsulimonas sp.]
MIAEGFQSAFYQTGGTLSASAPSYVLRNADRQLFEALSAGEYCSVLSSRQVGKSSVMVRAAERLRESGASTVILDLGGMGTSSPTAEQWYYGLLNEIGSQLGRRVEVRDAWRASSDLGPLQRWTDVLQRTILAQLDRPLVIFIDEIDSVRSLSFNGDEFLVAIRECFNRRAFDPQYNHLTFCLIGSATPADLIRDPNSTPFNIGCSIDLTDFTFDEALPLADGLTANGRDGHTLLKRVLYWTNGHPYLTQTLCDAAASAAAIDDQDVDKLCKELFLRQHSLENKTDTNLHNVSNRLLHYDRERETKVDLTAVLNLYQRVLKPHGVVPHNSTDRLVSRLELSGIVTVKNGNLRVRNRIYSQVFDRQWA